MSDTNQFDVRIAEINASKDIMVAILSRVNLPATDPSKAGSGFAQFASDLYKGIFKAVSNTTG